MRATEHWHSCCWLRPPLHLSPVPSPTSLLFLLLLLLLDSGNVIRRHHRRRGGHSTAIPKYLLYGVVYASFNVVVVVVVGWGAHFLRGFELWDTVLGLQEGSSLARHVDSTHFWNPGISSECTLFSICCVCPWCMRPNLSPAEAIRTSVALVLKLGSFWSKGGGAPEWVASKRFGISERVNAWSM